MPTDRSDLDTVTRRNWLPLYGAVVLGVAGVVTNRKSLLVGGMGLSFYSLTVARAVEAERKNRDFIDWVYRT
jgi:hypothetical protein